MLRHFDSCGGGPRGEAAERRRRDPRRPPPRYTWHRRLRHTENGKDGNRRKSSKEPISGLSFRRKVPMGVCE